MKNKCLNTIVFASLMVILSVSCSREEETSAQAEQPVRIEMLFSEDYPNYRMDLTLQLVASVSPTRVSGLQWNEIVHPSELVSWFQSGYIPISQPSYSLEPDVNVSSVTISGVVDANPGWSASAPLRLTVKFYASGRLIKTAVAELTGDVNSNFTYFVTYADF